MTELPLNEIKEIIRYAQLSAVTRLVGDFSIKTLAKGRDDATAFVRFAQAFVPFARGYMGLPDAFGFAAFLEVTEISVALASPVMAIVRHRYPDGMNEWREMIDAKTTGFEAAVKLLAELRPEFQAVMRYGRSPDELSGANRRELKEFLIRYEKRHPEEFAQIMALGDDSD